MASSALAASTTETTVVPRVSLSVNAPPSSSPFPSPSSSFVPPPIPGPHEFAVRPQPLLSLSQHPQAPPTAGDQERAQEASEFTSDKNISQKIGNTMIPPHTEVDGGQDAPHDAPDTPVPTPTVAQMDLRRIATVDPDDPRTPTGRSSTLPTGGDDAPSPYPAVPPSNRSSSSLTSSRPPPPSPRRQSKSSARSSTSSLSLSRTPSTSRHTQVASRLSMSMTPAGLEPESDLVQTPESAPEPQHVPQLIKVRDFAFPDEDERHEGLDDDVPKANRPKRINWWHYRMQSRDSMSSEEGDDNSEEFEDEGLYGWGFGSAGRFGWGTGIAGGQSSLMDFTRNLDEVQEHFDDEDEDPLSGSDLIGEAEEVPEPPLLPGVYRALYPFAPEGTAEMALEEDQLVVVLGRGGGVGWAVVVREGAGEGEQTHALVPESYLELVSLTHETE